MGLTGLCGAGFVAAHLLGPGLVPWQAVIGIAILFSFFVNMWVLAWPFTTLMFPTSAGGSVGGFMNTSAQLVGAAAPVISGYLINATGSYMGVFVSGTACAVIGCVAAVFLKEHRVI